jgi:tryptophanyl-tRNA synthetase
MKMSKAVILTGLRANNDLHIGNYFGALLPIVDMARHRATEYQVNLMVADLHSFTTPIDHTQLQAQIFNNLRTYVAAGLPLDEEDIRLFRQSYVPAHSELAWILGCFTGIGEMNRMVQFKEKSASLGEDRVSLGLFSYPVLMASDYLLYGASYVPVGDDQTQHLEFGRDIGERINKRFGELFEIPKPVNEQHSFFGNDQGLRIKDLADPTKKMSKSDETGKGVIFLNDAPSEAARKVMSATTDAVGSIHYDQNKQPGVSNLLQILALLQSQDLSAITAEWEGKTSYSELKSGVAGVIEKFLGDFQAKLAQVDDTVLSQKLETSEKLMNETANTTLLKVQKAVGLRA